MLPRTTSWHRSTFRQQWLRPRWGSSTKPNVIWARSFSFDALFTAAVGDSIEALHARDLFVFALEVTEYRAASAANPQAMVKALCKAMTKYGPVVHGSLLPTTSFR